MTIKVGASLEEDMCDEIKSEWKRYVPQEWDSLKVRAKALP